MKLPLAMGEPIEVGAQSREERGNVQQKHAGKPQ